MTTVPNVNLDRAAFEAGFAGNFQLVQEMVLAAKGGHLNTVLMGATKFIDAHPIDKVNPKNEQNAINRQLTTTHRQIAEWALQQGACWLFAFTQPKNESRIIRKNNGKDIMFKDLPLGDRPS